jgi:hypothetical protein
VCLYVLASHAGLLTEEELDARVRASVEARVSLKAGLCEDETVDQTTLRRLLEERKQYARRCVDCRITSYVLPGQSETCPYCQGPLFRRRHTPAKPPQWSELERVAADRLSSGRVATLNQLPETQPRRAAANAVVATGAPTRHAWAHPDRPLSPVTSREQREIPSPLEEMAQQAVVAFKDLRRQGLLPRIGLAVAAVLIGAGLWSMFAGMLEGIEWHISDPASVNHARARQCLRIVVITDPSRQDCLRFTKNVLNSSAVKEVSRDYVWQRDNAKGRIGPPDRSNDYAAAQRGTNRLPFVLIYDASAKVLTGCLGAGDMTPEGFLGLLEEAKQKAGSS